MSFKICSEATFSSICLSIQANFKSLVTMETSWQSHEENSSAPSDLTKPAGHKTQSSDVPAAHVSHLIKQLLHSPFAVANCPLGHDS